MMIIRPALLQRFILSIRQDIQRTWSSGAGMVVISRWLARSGGIVRRIILARILGAELIGNIAVASSVMSILYLPAGAGTFTPVSKLIAEKSGDKEVHKRVVGTSLRISSLTSLTMILALYCVLLFTDLIDDVVAKKLLYIIVLFLPLNVFASIFRSGLVGQRRIKLMAVLDIVFNLSDLLFVIPLVIFFALNGWLCNYIIVMFVGVLLYGSALRRILSFKWDKGIAKRIMSIGIFSFLGQFTGTLVLQFDTLTVSGILSDPSSTGIYNTASMAVQQLIIIPTSILVVVLPFVAENKDKVQKLKDRYIELRKKLFIVTTGISILAWIASPWVFPIFGPEFVASSAPFRILIVGLIFRSLFMLDNTYLDALGRTDLHFYGGLLTAVLAIVLNLTLIPHFGIIGAAWATTLSMVFGLIVRHASIYYFIFYKKAIR